VLKFEKYYFFQTRRHKAEHSGAFPWVVLCPEKIISSFFKQYKKQISFSLKMYSLQISKPICAPDLHSRLPHISLLPGYFHSTLSICVKVSDIHECWFQMWMFHGISKPIAHNTDFEKTRFSVAKTRLQGMGAEQNRIFFAVLVRWVGHSSARLCLQYLVDFC